MFNYLIARITEALNKRGGRSSFEKKSEGQNKQGSQKKNQKLHFLPFSGIFLPKITYFLET